ncbi:ATP-binding protein [Thalassovita sp.]|jgi:PAS domain S-box-containing protein|uniref:ATP-binding protein n=1 Tax=Thalassovita sp. TaxID=1979401 RepID=UPI003B59DFC0
MMLAGLVSLMLLVPIWVQVTERLEEMQVSRRDNVIWTITQLEVEFLELEKAALRLQIEDEAALPELHRRFDVFYSRVGTLQQSPLYRSAITISGEIVALERISEGIEALLPLMDGDKADLLNSAAFLQQELGRIRPDTRRVVTNANYVLTTSTETNRRETAELVMQLGVTSLVLFGSLFGWAFLFSRLFVIYRRRAEENLLTTQRLATVIETSPDAIVVTNTEGRIEDFNSAAAALLGYTPDQARGVGFAQMLRDADGQNVQLPLPGGAVFRKRLSGRTLSGLTLPLEVSQGATSLEQRPVYVYFLRDISDRLQAESDLQASLDKAVAGEQAKAHFLAVMSHEMRTPLNGILGVVDLMKDRLTEAKNRHYLSVLEQSGKVLLEHVNEVLDLTEIEARGITLNNAPFDLDAILDEIVASMRPTAEAKGNKLTLSKLPPRLGHFDGDAMRLRQVVANLLGNAIKFTQNGDIELLVTTQPTPDGMGLEIQVIDTGIGIPEDQQTNVFDDFVRARTDESTKIEGTGLGLGIVRRIVTVMKGEIGMESEPGEGSLFWVRLPVVPLQEAYDLKAQEITFEESRALSILIVEDNPTNRFVLREMLEQDGHTVKEAENGQVGVEMAREQPFDVILMDINMPVMGGVEATREVRLDGLNRDTRIVALTAHVLDQDAQLYHEVGMDAVVAKPISRRNIRGVLTGKTPDAMPTRRTATLDPLILDQLSGSMPAQSFKTMIQGVLDEGDAFIDALNQKQGWAHDEALTAVHNLSGTAAMIGATRLRNSLSQLENKLRYQGTVELNMWAEALRVLWAETREKLEVYAEGLASSKSA